jgi:hypothetical protein
MAFKPFGVLIKHCVQYMEDNSIKLIITENEIYEVQFSPRTFNEHCKYSEEQMLHGICGIEIGPRTLLFKSDTPFRIDDLEHHPIYQRDWSSDIPVSAFTYTGYPRQVIDSFIKELKYRIAKNDRIDELEKQTDKLKVMLSDRISSEEIIEEFTKKSARDDNEIERLNSLVATYTRIADTPVLVAEEIPDVSDLNAQIQSLKLQLATEKRISQKYAKMIQDRASALTAM